MEWTAEEIEERFVPAQYQAFWNIALGAPFLVGLPEYINHMFLHYNKEFCEEAGVDFPDESWTMDDMQEAAAALTKRKPDGTVEQFGGNFPCRGGALSARLFYHIKKWGGHIVNPDDPTDCMLDQPEAQEAMEWLRARIWDDETYNKGLVTGQFFGRAIFQSGKAATIHEGLQAGNLATKDDMPWDWDLTHEPLGPVQRAALLTTDGYMVWRETPNPEATWELMKWITGADWQGMRLEVTGQIPGYRPLVYEYPRLVRERWPRLDEVNMEVIPEALDMGYGSDDERFLKHMEAREILEPAGEQVFVVGEAPVSRLGEICSEIEAVQKM
jgi:ABC-type glycerol-3-phosphate transport system substrate-binding protein